MRATASSVSAGFPSRASMKYPRAWLQQPARTRPSQGRHELALLCFGSHATGHGHLPGPCRTGHPDRESGFAGGLPGALKGTVEPYDLGRERGTGWSFLDASGEALAQALRWALITWRDYPESIRAIQRRGMEQDLGWGRSAAEYGALFEEVRAELR